MRDSHKSLKVQSGIKHNCIVATKLTIDMDISVTACVYLDIAKNICSLSFSSKSWDYTRAPGNDISQERLI